MTVLIVPNAMAPDLRRYVANNGRVYTTPSQAGPLPHPTAPKLPNVAISRPCPRKNPTLPPLNPPLLSPSTGWGSGITTPNLTLGKSSASARSVGSASESFETSTAWSTSPRQASLYMRSARLTSVFFSTTRHTLTVLLLSNG